MGEILLWSALNTYTFTHQVLNSVVKKISMAENPLTSIGLVIVTKEGKESS
jgi:hypothetical protein